MSEHAKFQAQCEECGWSGNGYWVREAADRDGDAHDTREHGGEQTAETREIAPGEGCIGVPA